MQNKTIKIGRETVVEVWYKHRLIAFTVCTTLDPPHQPHPLLHHPKNTTCFPSDHDVSNTDEDLQSVRVPARVGHGQDHTPSFASVSEHAGNRSKRRPPFRFLHARGARDTYTRDIRGDRVGVVGGDRPPLFLPSSFSSRALTLHSFFSVTLVTRPLGTKFEAARCYESVTHTRS